MGSGGAISSPGYPSKYMSDLSCVHEIKVDSGKFIKLTFDKFELEANDNCDYDFVEIIDELETKKEKYCGSNLPPPFTSSKNWLKLKFKTDSSVEKTGFLCTYEAV